MVMFKNEHKKTVPSLHGDDGDDLGGLDWQKSKTIFKINGINLQSTVDRHSASLLYLRQM